MQEPTVVITDSKVDEDFEALVKHTNTTVFDTKVAKIEEVLAEKHTIPSEYKVIQVSTRAKVEFNK